MNYIFYFTGTGNSLYIARSIANKVGGELLSIPQVLKGKKLRFKGEKVGIVIPCYGWNVPEIVREFIEKVEIECRYSFSIITYGNISGGAVEVFSNFSRKNNFNLDYSNEILMVDNYIPFYDIGKQIREVGKKEIERNLGIIIDDTEEEKNYIKRANIIKKIMSRNIYRVTDKHHRKLPKKFEVEGSCTSCSICTKLCPVGNIKVEGKPSFGSRCLACLACTHNCPSNSIRMSNEKNKVRFRNENISLKELIESNK